MKKLNGIILIICLFGPFAGYYLYLQLEKQELRAAVKKQITAGIDDAHLVKFEVFPEELKTRFKWKHADEFEYKGLLYDIVRKKILHGKIILWCWQDDDESRLNDEIEKLIARSLDHHQQDKENQQQLQKLFKLVYLHNAYIAINFNTIFQPPFRHREPEQNEYSVYLRPPVPPPQAG